MIKFNEELHCYTNSENKVYTSATQLIGKYHIDFKQVEYFWALYKSLQYLSNIDKEKKIKKYTKDLDIFGEIFSSKEYSYYSSKIMRSGSRDYFDFLMMFNEDQSEKLKEVAKHVLSNWKAINKEALKKGNFIHLLKEDSQFSDGYYLLNNKKIKVHPEVNVTGLENLTEGIYPELRVWNHEYSIAGTIDQPIFYKDKKFKIRDFKTNSEIKIENKYQNMLAPISHIEDCNYWHYALQLSLYAWLLESHGYELIEDGLEIEHLETEETEDGYKVINNIVYPVPYLKREIEAILKNEQLHKDIRI